MTKKWQAQNLAITTFLEVGAKWHKNTLKNNQILEELILLDLKAKKINKFFLTLYWPKRVSYIKNLCRKYIIFKKVILKPVTVGITGLEGDFIKNLKSVKNSVSYIHQKKQALAIGITGFEQKKSKKKYLVVYQ